MKPAVPLSSKSQVGYSPVTADMFKTANDQPLIFCYDSGNYFTTSSSKMPSLDEAAPTAPRRAKSRSSKVTVIPVRLRSQEMTSSSDKSLSSTQLTTTVPILRPSLAQEMKSPSPFLGPVPAVPDLPESRVPTSDHHHRSCPGRPGGPYLIYSHPARAGRHAGNPSSPGAGCSNGPAFQDSDSTCSKDLAASPHVISYLGRTSVLSDAGITSVAITIKHSAVEEKAMHPLLSTASPVVTVETETPRSSSFNSFSSSLSSAAAASSPSTSSSLSPSTSSSLSPSTSASSTSSSSVAAAITVTAIGHAHSFQRGTSRIDLTSSLTADAVSVRERDSVMESVSSRRAESATLPQAPPISRSTTLVGTLQECVSDGQRVSRRPLEVPVNTVTVMPRYNSIKAMSTSVKRSAPQSPPSAGVGVAVGGGETSSVKAASLHSFSAHGSSNGSAGSVSLSYASSEVSDDVNMNQVEDKVTLEVVLPSGTSTEVTVDSSIPMMDLLVHLAAWCKVPPSGHTLLVQDPETGKNLDYKASQTIGSLGVGVVHIVSKSKKPDLNRSTPASDRNNKTFEITNRFTINLPGGQKAVMRISPQLTLEQVFARVCQDKGLDGSRYTLQHPSDPLRALDLKATIADSRLSEINLIVFGASTRAADATQSMPDLHKGSMTSSAASSSNPSSWYMPTAGETKKKKGLFSFFKKDKKFKLADSHIEPGPVPTPQATASTAQAGRRSTTPPPMRRSSDGGAKPAAAARPTTMYAAVFPTPVFGATPPSPDDSRGLPPPVVKKRHAPAPPPALSGRVFASPLDKPAVAVAASTKASPAGSPAAASAARTVAAPALTKANGHIHSRNSSDSSGYHEAEVTLSGAESPEALPRPGPLLSGPARSNSGGGGGSGSEGGGAGPQTSVDTTSIGSGDNHPSYDSGIHEGQRHDRPKPAPSVKKKKAPAPPPILKSQPSRQESLTSPNAKKRVSIVEEATHVGMAPAPEYPEDTPPLMSYRDFKEVVRSFPDDADLVIVPSLEAISEPDSEDEEFPPKMSYKDFRAEYPEEEETADDGKDPRGYGKDDREQDAQLQKTPTPELDYNSDAEEGDAFNIDDILNAVTFDEEPPLRSAPGKHGEPEQAEEERLAMVETASIASEEIEVTEEEEEEEEEGQDEARAALRPPCEFVPPPPPTEPPPPMGEEEDPELVERRLWLSNPQYLDKGTVVGDDNTSLAPPSLKSSPVLTPRHFSASGSERRLSESSISSVDTVQGLSLAFEQTIALGQEVLDSELWLQGDGSGYTTDMARFVASEMNRLQHCPLEESAELSSNASTSLSLHDSVKSESSTGSVVYVGGAADALGPQHWRGDSSDSQSSSLGSSSSPPEEPVLASFPRGPRWGSGDDDVLGVRAELGPMDEFAFNEEISVPTETVPPPPEFGGSTDEEEGGEEIEKEEEEEMVTVTEEYIVPMGPSGLNYSAAVKVSQEEVVNHSGKSRVAGGLRHETTPLLRREADRKPEKAEPTPPKPARKEEFVLTMEDLSSVKMVPERPKSQYVPPKPKAKPTLTPIPVPEPEPAVQKHEPPSKNAFSSPARNSARLAYVSNHGHVQPVLAAASRYTPSDPPTREPGIASLYLPAMRSVNLAEPVPFSDDDRSSISSADHAYRPSSAINVSCNSSVADDVSDRHSSAINVSCNSSVADDVSDVSSDADTTWSEEAQPALQQQYREMQEQLALWQQQLERNQTLLATQLDEGEPGPDELRQALENQMAQGLQILETMRQNMQALQLKQQQQQQGGVARHAPPPPIPASLPPALPVATSPPPPPTPPPTPPLLQVSAAPTVAGWSRSAIDPAGRGQSAKSQTRPLSSRFQPKLDPREELLQAIRSFGGRNGLNGTSDTK